MASSWSDLKIQLMAAGENVTTWGNVTNLNLTNLEAMIAETATVTFASANETLTLTNTTNSQSARFARLEFDGTTGGATRDLIVPDAQKTFIIYNGCADTVRVKTSAGTGVNVPAGKSTTVVVDGTNVVAANDYMPALRVGTAPTFDAPLGVASGGTGSNTATGALASVFPVGAIIDYGGSVAPTGWVLAYGQNVSRSTYSALFAVFGTTYGVGDNSTTFGLPDYRGRVGAGKDDMGGVSAARLSTVMTSTTLGNVGGAQQITLDTTMIPAHAHAVGTLATASNGAHTHDITDPGHVHTSQEHIHQWNNGASGVGTITIDGTNTSGGSNAWNSTNDPVAYSDPLVGDYYTTGKTLRGGTVSDVNSNTTGISTASNGAHTHTLSGSTANAGGGLAHNNVQPTIIVNKIIFTGVA